LFDDADGFGKEIALVVLPELLTRNREWRTRQTTSYQIDAAIGGTVECPQVLLDDVPTRSVCTKRRATVPIDLDQGRMLKSSEFQTQGLASRPCT
jgi:hypothetical protein